MPDANLESGLGLSSLERVELLSALEDRYQVDLNETNFANAATVGDLEKLLQGERASTAAASFTIQLFTIPDGPCAGRPRGCAWRRIICWRARRCFFWDGPA